MVHRFLLFLAALSLGAAELRVMTFNVRYPNPKDGEDAWEKRRDLLVETIKKAKPDLMGTQELFHEQGEFIVGQLPEYAWFGVSRRGNKEDEHMGVFYLVSRLKPVDTGTFWLSETPDRPGSMSWGVTLPRIVTWAIFEDLQTKRRFSYYNTHFAHRKEDDEARRKSAELIASRMPKDGSFIITGDFNSPYNSDAYKKLVPPMIDVMSVAKEKDGPQGTFHGFTGTPGKDRIDWVLFRAPWRVKKVDVLTRNRNGRYPSDHFPVLAIFTL
ncbi:MAG: endonuclease/exonuclease/phosphatase family protein [Acidobacteria bacterium]|nr:endonuclease/exonuclease/phosphatase family protein [Acidobacteriota bacterium]